MLIVYLSLTGNVRDFVNKTAMRALELNYSNPFAEVSEEFVAIVPSYDEDVTNEFVDFIGYRNNEKYLRGFAGSGNLNFDKQFCFSAKELAARYNKPLLHTFEFSGTEADINKFIEEVMTVGNSEVDS